MKIAIVLYPGLTVLDAIGPYEVFNQLPRRQIVFVGAQKGPVRSDSRALALGVDATFEEVSRPDILLVPGGLAGTLAATKNRYLLRWVRESSDHAQWVLSVCTGSLILGAAGLLKGLSATTHWAAKDLLSHYGASYVPERFVRQGKIVMAAGVSAGIDMALFIARELVGTIRAQAMQLAIEYDPAPPIDAGSLRKASAEVITLAKRRLHRAALREVGSRTWEKIIGGLGTSDSWNLPTRANSNPPIAEHQ